MIDVLMDTLLDTLKLLPFLFLAFLLIEIIEHKINNKKIIISSGKFGPLIASLLGSIPQCGFSATITNFYITRLVTLGTLISVYLSTSDEMIPIMISSKVGIAKIFQIILIKIIIGFIVGTVIDFILRKKEQINIEELCKKEHCHCEKSIITSALKHTLNIIIFIFFITFMLNIAFEYFGNEQIEKLLLKNSIFSPFISSLIGLIPNCASSVMITELYLNNTITFGSCMAGLLTGSGIGILILFKANKNINENIKILSLVYFIGAISGIIIDMLKIV